jgi:hypothetical protein
MKNLLDNPKSFPVASLIEKFFAGFDPLWQVWELRELLIVREQIPRKRSILPKFARGEFI